MRRVGALAITMLLAWFVVARTGGGTGQTAALALGVALIAGSIVGWLFEFLRLPRITGYLVFGLLCGPYVANIITQQMARDLQLANGLAIAVVAFIAGLQLNLSRLRPQLGTLSAIGGVTVLVGWAGLFALLYAVWPWLPIEPALAPLQRAAAVALAVTILMGLSPTVTIAIITDSRARGPLSEMAVAVVVLADLAIIVLFGVCLQAARFAFDATGGSGLVRLAATGWALVGSLAFGAIVGALFALYLRYIGREVTVVLLAMCAVLTGIGSAMHFEPLLAAVAAGLVVQNVMPPTGEVLRDAIERGAMPLLVLFFAAAGASLHIEAVATIGVTALALSATRLALVRAGTRLGAWMAHQDTREARLLWRALMSKAGVTLGLTVLVAGEFAGWGLRLQTLMVAVIALHELVGPILFRSALVQLKEAGRSDGGLVVVSNREPWMHEYDKDGEIRVRKTPGGVSVALDALMRERGGVWIAHGAGSADRAVSDETGSVEVPPEAPDYRLRRIWLSAEEEERYYAGFANSGLWPLCHQAHVRPVFRAEDWDAYQAVNRRFAKIAAIEAPADSSVFLNDYHLALVAKYLRERRPLLRVALFWHIPWPDPDRLRICPWRREILEGLLNNDLLAFQLPRDQRNFLAAVAGEIGASISGETVYYGDRPVRVVAIPIGADYDRITEILADDELPARMARLQHELRLEGRVVGLGVDRLDYTKGIPERIGAIERVLEQRPDLRERFVFVQIGVPSRADVPGYAEISAEIDDLIGAGQREQVTAPSRSAT